MDYSGQSFLRLVASPGRADFTLPVSNGRHMINPYPVDMGPGLFNYPQHLVFSQSPAFSDVSLPLDDLYRSQSAPPCLEQGNNLFNSPLSIPQLFPSCDVFSFAASTHGSVHSSSKEHIPRPPNAFMLYRSHMLKSRGNTDPEKRQQNLSRIAGQLWRAMSKEDRAVWHKKAAEVQAAHYAKYPGYKFKPNRKSAKSAKTLHSGTHYQKPTEQLCAESSIGPVRRARSSRVRPQGVTRDYLLGALETQFPSTFSSPARLSPLHFPPFLPAFSLPERMCGNEQPNIILPLPQSQCTNALGLELSSSQPSQPTTPRSELAEMLSGLALDLDAVRSDAPLYLLDLIFILTIRRQLQKLSKGAVTYPSMMLLCPKTICSLEWSNCVFPTIQWIMTSIVCLHYLMDRWTDMSRQANLIRVRTLSVGLHHALLIRCSATSSVLSQCRLTMKAMSGAIPHGCLTWIRT
jgi:hypothetical protein